MHTVDYIKSTYMGDWVVQEYRRIDFNEVLNLGNNEETIFKLVLKNGFINEELCNGNLDRIIDRLEGTYNTGKIREILKKGIWYVSEEVVDKF